MTVTLPFTLTNGTSADADQVMADFNALKTAVDTLQAAVAVPPGSVFAYAGATAPAGFLLCDGTAVSRATYAALFTAIGTVYGAGNGTTTFNLPDLRGRVPLGVDGAAGRIASNDALGNSGGAQTIAYNEGVYTAGGVKAVNGFAGTGPNLQPYQVVNFIVHT